jgi:uncharacterized radical SAM protein YgiQ
MFLPTTQEEIQQLGWEPLDVILVSGDSYIDSPYIGIAVIGKILVQAGYRVGVIAQPDIHSAQDISRLGKPRLFWGVTAGSVDSMVANTTASRKKRRTDDYTPGGVNDRRPDRATIVYSNLIRRYFKDTAPIVLGGIEASLRRIAHYDFWSDRIRRSVLFDAKADILVYGMGEKAVLALAERLQAGQDIQDVRGICLIASEKPNDALELPAYELVRDDKNAFIDMFHSFYLNNDPHTAKKLYQRQDTRYLVQNPPAEYLSQAELDQVYALDFERAQHPYYARLGKVKALETIRFSIPTHRGCYGECNFCAIAVHEGRTVRWRSQESIVAEAVRMTRHPDFKGYIFDVGGPTANMYGYECEKKIAHGSCPAKRCLSPELCPVLEIDHSQQLALLRRLRKVGGVKKVFVASGIRYDLLLADQAHGDAYLQEVVMHHTSGQLKVAPEHTEDHVLARMGKPGSRELLEFKRRFDSLSRSARKKQYLTYYMIAAHPGCRQEDMRRLKVFASQKLKITPEQVQIFTPTPSTYSSLMYYTEMDPFTRQPIFVEKDLAGKNRQKQIVTGQIGNRGRTRKPGRKA